MKNKRDLIIVLMLLIGVALTIGYAVLSQTLIINGRANIASNSWIIYFDHLVERPGTMEATTPATINSTKDTINFGITLDKPGDNYTFEVDIINDGTIDAMVDSVSLSGIPESLNGIIEWKVNYLDGTEVQKCDELLANSRRRIKVVVNYNKDIDSLPDEQDLDLTFMVKYVQLDNSECSVTTPAGEDPIDLEDGRYTLTIDPNYGIYNGTDDVTTVRMAPGEVYVIGDNPTQEAHTFDGWTTSNDDAYNIEGNLITMPSEDVTVTANYIWDIVDIENNIGYCFSIGNTYYKTFDSAIEAVEDGQTIKLLENSCKIENSVDIQKTIAFTFDLNGHIITKLNRDFYNSKANFTITDTSKRKSGVFAAPQNYPRAITNYATITIEGGTYEIGGSFIGSVNPNSVENISNAIINIDGSTSLGNVEAIMSSYELNISNVDFNFKNTKGYASAIDIYASATSETKEFIINDVNINIETPEDGTGSLQMIRSGKSFELNNVNINIKGGFDNYIYGIYNTDENNESTLNNVNLNIDVDMHNSLYGIYVHKGKMENINVDIKTTSSTGSANVAAVEAFSGSSLKDITIKVDNQIGQTQAIEARGVNIIENAEINALARKGICYGVEGTGVSTLKNVNLSIESLDVTSSTTSYGVRATNIIDSSITCTTHLGGTDYCINSVKTITNSTIKANSQFSVYAIYADNVTITDSQIEANSTKDGIPGYPYDIQVYGIYGTNATLNNSSLKVNGSCGSLPVTFDENSTRECEL